MTVRDRSRLLLNPRPRKGLTAGMNDAAVKAAADRFVKDFSFTARREIEKCIRNALANGSLKGDENFTAGVALTCDDLDLNVAIFSKIEL